jgi:hypothetical protein
MCEKVQRLRILRAQYNARDMFVADGDRDLFGGHFAAFLLPEGRSQETSSEIFGFHQ